MPNMKPYIASDICDGEQHCPYRDCSFTGTDAEVDEHRATGIHDDEPQGGSNR